MQIVCLKGYCGRSSALILALVCFMLTESVISWKIELSKICDSTFILIAIAWEN